MSRSVSATFSTTQIEKLASMVRGSFVTADRGSIVLGNDFCKNQSGTIQRTKEGTASENLAHFLYNGDNQWRVETMSDKINDLLVLLNEVYPCLKYAVDIIHDRFWVVDSMSVKEVYKAAQDAGIFQEWLDGFVLAKLNYQVGNGGFAQWVDNGYAVLYNETREALERIGTKNAFRVWTMLNTLKPHLDEQWSFSEEMDEDECVPCPTCGGHGSPTTCDECEGDGVIEVCGSHYCPGYDQADKLDDEYYAINDTFMQEVESYISDQPLERVDFQKEMAAQATCRYPNVRAKIIGSDGNAFSIMGIVHKALRRANVPKEEIEAYLKEASSKDYNHMLATTMEWVVVE